MVVGVVIGTCTLRLIGPLSTPAFEWLDRFTSNPERSDREIELILEGEIHSQEFSRLCDKEAYMTLTIIGPLVSSFHGLFFGGIGGALWKLEFPFGISASQGALYGALFGVAICPFIAALVFAIIIPGDKAKSVSSQIWQRVLVLATPFLVFPIVWYCLTSTFKRLRGNTA